MFEAYLDESGIHDGASVCIVAGYFATRTQWQKLEKKWCRAFIGSPIRMQDFHAKDLLNKQDPKIQNLLRSLSEAIGSCPKVHPVTRAVLVEDFFSFPVDWRRFMTGATFRHGKLIDSGSPDRPYYIPFQECLKQVTEHVPEGGRVHFFFGIDKKFGDYAEALYRKCAADDNCFFQKKLGTIGRPLAKETPQLQAADLLAHLGYRYALRMQKQNAWGKNMPDELLGNATRGTLEENDHAYQDRGCLERHVREGIPDFLRRLAASRQPTKER